MRNAPVDDHKADRLFSEVVGGRYAGRGDEFEVGFAVFTQSLGHVEGFALLLLAVFVQAGGDVVESRLQEAFAGALQRTAKSIRVEILGPGGVPDPQGFEQSEEIYGDEIERAVTWKRRRDLRSLAGQPVRLRFILKDADLYALRFLEGR